MVAIPIAGMVVLALIPPLTLSGLLYLIGAVAFALGLCGVAWGYKRGRWGLAAGLALILAVALVRMLAPQNGSIHQLLLPQGSTSCGVNCLIDEQDAALFSTRVLPFVGWIPPREQEGLVEAMVAGYQQMAAVQPMTASPFIRTYLGLQRADAFDAVVIEPNGDQPPELGLIFLHGFTGNFTMPCWLMAQTVSVFQALTVCPSVGWKGDWWTADGEATLRETIAYMQQRGVNRIILAGLSNGALGSSELAFKLKDDLAGLILLSGASLDAQDSDLPLLILTGSRDERMPLEMIRAYGDRMGEQATFVELDSDHFMLVKRFDEVRQEIDSWLRELP